MQEYLWWFPSDAPAVRAAVAEADFVAAYLPDLRSPLRHAREDTLTTAWAARSAPACFDYRTLSAGLNAERECYRARVARALALAAWGKWLRPAMPRLRVPNAKSWNRDWRGMGRFLRALADLDALADVVDRDGYARPRLRPDAPLLWPTGGRPRDLDAAVMAGLIRYVRGLPDADVVDLGEARVVLPSVSEGWDEAEVKALAEALDIDDRTLRHLREADPFAELAGHAGFALAVAQAVAAAREAFRATLVDPS